VELRAAEGQWREAKRKMGVRTQVDAIHKVYALKIAQWVRENGGRAGPNP